MQAPCTVMSAKRQALLAVTVIACCILLLTMLGRSTCVVLPNGYMIGHASIIPLYRRFFFENAIWNSEADLVARTSHMVLFERHPSDPDMVVMLYPGGRTTMDGRVIMPLIYNESFDGRWNDERHPLGASIASIGLKLIYERLKQDRRFEHRYCQPPLISFHPVD